MVVRAKVAMVPIGATRAVVVESRHNLGYDRVPNGVVVYLVDSSLSSGEGPLVVQNPNQRVLGKGGSITVEGVTITVLAQSPESDLVEITVG